MGHDKKHEKGRDYPREFHGPPKGKFMPKTGDYVPNTLNPVESDSLLFKARHFAPDDMSPRLGEDGDVPILGEWDEAKKAPRRVLTEADLDQLITGQGVVQREDLLQFHDGEKYPAGAILDAFKNAGVTEMEFLRMSEKERRVMSQKIRRELDRRRAKLQAERTELQDEDFRLSIKERICEILMKPLVMEKPQGSSMHHFMQHVHERSRGAAGADGYLKFLNEEFQLFVIEHDWAKAFGGSGDFGEGEIQLPFDHTCFEMRISGMRVLAMVGSEDGERKVFLAFGVNGQWTGNVCGMETDGTLNMTEDVYTPEQWQQLLTLIRAQVRAVCIMLDAEVAETELRRAPEKLNRQRERQGRAPLQDYHVVRLAHRHRVRAAETRAYDEPGTRKRLHFRRGHDRHYPNYKVWIKWQLVGDPDLGFVDKEYRL